MSHCELLQNNENKTCHPFAPPAHRIRFCCLHRCHLRGQNSPTLNNPCKEGLTLHITPPRVTAGSNLTWEVLFTFGSRCLSESSGCKVSVKKLTRWPLRKSLRFHRFTFCVALLFFSGAKANLRDYSGRLASHYMKIKEPEGPEDETDLCECLRLMVLEQNMWCDNC